MRAGSAFGLGLLALLAWVGPVAAQPRPVTPQVEEARIGSWLLRCAADPMTDEGNCVLRHATWLEVPQPRADGSGAPGLALEAVRMGERMVPAVTTRGLSVQDASRAAFGLASSAELRFGRNALLSMPCGIDGRDILCLPLEADAERAARELVEATTVLMRMRGSTPLPVAGPTDPVALDLAGTEAALEALRRKGGQQQPMPVRPAVDLRSLFERWMKGG